MFGETGSTEPGSSGTRGGYAKRGKRGDDAMAYESLMVFTGNANPLLAHNVVKRLNIPIGHAVVGKFSDGEVMVEMHGERPRQGRASCCSPPARPPTTT